MMDAQSNIIEMMISQVDEFTRQLEEEQRQNLQAKLTNLQMQIEAALGETWPVLSPYRRNKGIYSESHNRVWLTIPFMPIYLELAEFYVQVNSSDQGIRLSIHSSTEYWNGGTPVEKLPEFLAERRKAFPEWYQKYLEKETEPFKKALSYWHNKSQEKADDALAQLILIDPDHESNWRVLREEWQRVRDQDAKREQDAAQHKLELEKASAAYEQAYSEWLNEHNRIYQINQEKATKLQNDLNKPFEIWELTYGVVGDEDGEAYVDTRMALLASGIPIGRVNGNWWAVLEGGEIKETHFFHPVRLDGPIMVRPTNRSHAYAHSFFVPEIGESIWHKYGTDIAGRIQIAGFITPPAPPVPVEKIEQGVRNRTGKLEPDWMIEGEDR